MCIRDRSVAEGIVRAADMHGLPIYADRGFVRRDYARENADQRRLSGAVFTHERVNFAGAQLETRVNQRGDSAVALRGLVDE